MGELLIRSLRVRVTLRVMTAARAPSPRTIRMTVHPRGSTGTRKRGQNDGDFSPLSSFDACPLSSKESSDRETSVSLSSSTSFTVTRTAGDEPSLFVAGVRLTSTCVSAGLARPRSAAVVLARPSSAAARAFNRSRLWAIVDRFRSSVIFSACMLASSAYYLQTNGKR